MRDIRKAITTHYLEMTSPAQLRPAALDSALRNRLQLIQAEIACPAYNRFLYSEVGAAWSWTDKLPWTAQQWQDYVNRPNFQTWVAYVCGTPAGYFELEQQSKSAQILYFGLLPQFIGQGLGGPLLTYAVERAWHMQVDGPVERVWLHTCTLDHAHALANYQARGFQIYRQESSAAPDESNLG